MIVSLIFFLPWIVSTRWNRLVEAIQWVPTMVLMSTKKLNVTTCNEPAQEAASGETGVDPDSSMNRSACIYVRAYVCDKLLRV